ncbi:MAG: hypothetical protein JNJ88_08465 [Planctomycetes bacterium]|nr:hypothetical protein [Planctomycetota bacterium]
MNETVRLALSASLAFAALLGATASRAVGEGGTTTKPAPIQAAKAALPEELPKSALRLLLIGPKHGNFEPCGCTGGQLGGLGRMRMKLMAALGSDPGAVVIDAATLVKSGAEIEEVRGEFAASIYQLLPISAVGLAPIDLVHGENALEIRSQLMEDMTASGYYPSILHKCVALQGSPDTSGRFVKRADLPGKSADGAGWSVRVVSAFAESDKQAAVVDAVRAEFAAPRAADAGRPVNVLVFHGLRAQARSVASQIPQIDVVLASLPEGSGGPDLAPEAIARNNNGVTTLLSAGEKGQHVVELGFVAGEGGVRAASYRVMTVDGSVPNDEQVQSLIDGYREKLHADQWREKLAGKQPAPPAGGYVGSDACRSCHRTSYATWKNSKHAHAYESLEKSERSKGGQWDPQCLKCHVVGWHNLAAEGEPTGFLAVPKESKDPRDYVGCESCHGPGGEHVKQHKAALTPEEHAAVAAKLVKDVTCQKCHDHENSPNFDRDAYWPKIQHGKDPTR